MKLLKTLAILLLLGLIGAATVIWSGVYNIGADDPHWSATYRVLEIARQRSIATRAAGIETPDLSDPALIRSGAGNYSAMCVTCHLSPGAEETELSVGLYPKPPRWDALAEVEPRQAYWALKHGIKASGMPAWGKSMDDRYLWGMVAFMQQFPGMTPAEYRKHVDASPGHDHGGGETDVGGGDPHAHHQASSAERSSFEPIEDPMAAPEGDDHRDDHQH
ncbi:c-type cytochrome [Pseudomarimonas arenosa]|uniref:Cytochrome c n=1 Tax=Pseudomarimonas arenosa TaxID=2774145 RepID=A0AAW3ZGG9_9GAMM|nr:cytochrome c [Pseudomarimonas arenosa]MBD8524394.1 cytochrome c [Pseudomarimonas arenosa]